MAQIAINKVTNANVYIDGVSYLGRAAEIDLASITQKMSDHVALGMMGSFEFASGVDKMEARIMWNAIYTDAMKVVADPFTVRQLQCRASLETYTSNGRVQVPVVCYMSGQFKSYQAGNFKQHENVEIESMFNVFYLKQEVNGEAIVEFDAFANIYKVNGVDIAAQYRANIGQ